MIPNGVASDKKETCSPLRTSSTGSSSSPLMKFSSYVLAIRPWSLSASLIPTFLGSALAYKLPGATGFSPITLVLTLITVACVHGAGNVVNTYFDYIKGVDSRKSDDRILVDQLLSQDELVSLGAWLYAAGCLAFVLLATMSPAKMEHLALVYFGGLSSSFLYTGGIGLKYIALGDVLILIIFGPISVLFAFMAQTGYIEWNTMYYAIPLALSTEAILHSNNTRDLESDKQAGIVTLAILIGYTASHVLYAFLLFAPYVTFVVLACRYSFCFLLPVVTLPQAFQIEKSFRNPRTIQDVPKETASLNLYLGGLYIIACLLIDRLPYLQSV